LGFIQQQAYNALIESSNSMDVAINFLIDKGLFFSWGELILIQKMIQFVQFYNNYRIGMMKVISYLKTLSMLGKISQLTQKSLHFSMQ
jgi:hypothetical protein